MKYTALYWALRFVEEQLDIHIKEYGDYAIKVFAEEQRVDYGERIKIYDDSLNCLIRHKDFVILECVDRLLSKGYQPEDIVLDGRSGQPDVKVAGISIYCYQWGKDYQNAVKDCIYNDNTIIYTSRLVSGLLEYKNIIYCNQEKFNYGFFEKDIALFQLTPTKRKETSIEKLDDIEDFIIEEDELVQYIGKKSFVKVPEGIKTLGASAFWNNTYVENVKLPQSLERIGGDCFYYCTNLKNISIPSKVNIMGNNPFAGCPKLTISNNSSEFVLDEGVLYNKDKSNLIHYTIQKTDRHFSVPKTVTCIGKHSFFACNNLRTITLPSSIKKLENNPFSGCEELTIKNYSPYYYFENGVIYNKFKTTVVGCLNSTKAKILKLPDTVTLISRNAFWNCKGIEKIVISKNVNRIGYNPFAGCENLLLTSKSKSFLEESNIIYNEDKTQLLCATNKAVGKEFFIRSGIVQIGRSAFSSCIELENIDLGEVKSIEKSAFTNCISLKELFVPDSVEYIGEWAFSYCKNLKLVSINKHTFIDKNAFNECDCVIKWRN